MLGNSKLKNRGFNFESDDFKVNFGTFKVDSAIFKVNLGTFKVDFGTFKVNSATFKVEFAIFKFESGILISFISIVRGFPLIRGENHLRNHRYR